VAPTGEILLRLLHAALLLAAAPLVMGLTRFVRARLDGRRGASPVQPYRDLARALRRRPMLAEGASPVSAAAPLVAVAALALAAGLLPPADFPGVGPAPAEPPAVGLAAVPAAVSGDLVLIAALLGLARFAWALALLDAGTASGGLGAARLWARPVLFDPALLLVAMCAATLAGAEAAGVGESLGTRVPLLLAAGAVLLVGAADAPRSPVAGEGSPPHDLGGAPEMVGAEFSGWQLALWDYARALRCTLFLALLAALLPGPPTMAGVAGAVFRPLLGLAELVGICVVLAAVENGLAVLYPDRVPVLGVGALVLAAAAAALLLLGSVAA
jgi:formate hydrogenlyase subunit 4